MSNAAKNFDILATHNYFPNKIIYIELNL